VIGGLLVATFTTLFFVPVLYTMLRHAQPEPEEDWDALELPVELPDRPTANV